MPESRLGRRMAMVAALGLALGLTLSVGCRDSKVAVMDGGGLDAAHAPVAATRTGPGTRDGQWQGADARSTWHAILNGPQVTQLDEVAIATDSSRTMRQIQWDSTGHLTSLREERVLVVRGQAVVPDTLHTIITLAWQGDQLTQQEKRVNGAVRPLQPYERDNLMRHIDELLTQLRAGSGTPATPTPK